MEDFKRKQKTMKEHQNRIKMIYEWFQINYPDYFEVGVLRLSGEEQAEGSRSHHFKNLCDLWYTGINLDLLKAFITFIKKKGNGNHCSFVHIQKFHDAIIFGAEEAQELLSATY